MICSLGNFRINEKVALNMSDIAWKPISDPIGWVAPEGEKIWTKIDDGRGERNVAELTRYGNLWWTDPDQSKGMYVYYTPTHWHR